MSEETQAHAEDTHAKCERLLANPDVAWFIAEAVNKPLAEAEGTLKDLRTGKDARENAAHVRQALDEVAKFLELRRDIAARQKKN